MDRVALIVLLILALAGVMTSRQLPVWSSDVTLWAQAADANRTAPRPAFNLALAHQRAGRLDAATRWYAAAMDRAATHRQRDEYRARIQQQIAVMEHYGYFACVEGLWPSLCLP